MKKVSLNLAGLFIMSILIASCSSENTLLSQFSKRKYLKKVKDKNIQYKDPIEELTNEKATNNEIENIFAFTQEELTTVEVKNEHIELEEKITTSNSEQKIEKILNEKTSEVYKFKENLNKRSNEYNSSENISTITKAHNARAMDDLTLVLAILFLLIIPPISVLFSDPNKFLINLILFTIGILAFIGAVAGGGVIGLAIIAQLFILASFIHALVVLIRNA